MASPGSVVIQFLAKTSDSVRDIAKLGRSLDQLDDSAHDTDRSLTDTQRAIDKTGDTATSSARDLDRAETGLDQLGDEADRTADRLRRSAQDMAAGIQSGTDKIERETDGLRGHMRDTGAEAGSEFISNMAEGIGSGSGSVTDVVQGTLGGLTNLAAGMAGPIGMAAGAAAAGVGLAFAAVTKAAEKAKQQVADISDALIELGETSSDAAKKVLWDEWVASLDDANTTLHTIRTALQEAGIEQGVFQEAITGSAAAQDEVRKKVEAAIAKLEEQADTVQGINGEDRERLNGLKEINKQLGIGNESIDTANQRLEDTEYLTGDAADEAKRWADEQNRVYNETHKIKTELNNIPNTIPVNVIVTRKDRNGNPSKLGPGQLAAPMAMTAAAPVTNVTVYAQASGIPATPRALAALLEGHNVRMGRKPSQPRAVAW